MKAIFVSARTFRWICTTYGARALDLLSARYGSNSVFYALQSDILTFYPYAEQESYAANVVVDSIQEGMLKPATATGDTFREYACLLHETKGEIEQSELFGMALAHTLRDTEAPWLQYLAFEKRWPPCLLEIPQIVFTP